MLRGAVANTAGEPSHVPASAGARLRGCRGRRGAPVPASPGAASLEWVEALDGPDAALFAELAAAGCGRNPVPPRSVGTLRGCAPRPNQNHMNGYQVCFWPASCFLLSDMLCI